LIIGLSKSIDKYEALAEESKDDITNVLQKNTGSQNKKEAPPTQEKIDSIIKELDEDLSKSFIPIPTSAKERIIEEVKKEAQDTTSTKSSEKNNVTFNFGGDTRLDEFSQYIKGNPDTNINTALDSLGYEKNFTNRFLLTKTKSLYALTKSEETKNQFLSEVLSYGSVALFIFLPFFTLFLRFYYIRRKFTYIDHLIFVFHIQTVFFMLFSIFLILKLCYLQPNIWIFTSLFLIYLFIAMKKFYEQGYVKTFFKFLLLNASYIFVSSIGISFLFLFSLILF
jgi:gas vesicle protein